MLTKNYTMIGLKTGFTFGASMMGAVFGFGAVKILQKVAPGVKFLGMENFGPQENSIIQAAATGAGGMAGLFVAALPAMYRLELLHENVKDDFGRILTLTLVCGTFGIFFAVPLRKFFIINVSRDLKLVFPSRKFLSSKGQLCLVRLLTLEHSFGDCLCNKQYAVSFCCCSISTYLGC